MIDKNIKLALVKQYCLEVGYKIKGVCIESSKIQRIERRQKSNGNIALSKRYGWRSAHQVAALSSMWRINCIRCVLSGARNSCSRNSLPSILTLKCVCFAINGYFMSAHGCNLLKNNTKVNYNNLTRVFAGLLCLPRPTEYFFLIVNAHVVLKLLLKPNTQFQYFGSVA